MASMLTSFLSSLLQGILYLNLDTQYLTVHLYEDMQI